MRKRIILLLFISASFLFLCSCKDASQPETVHTAPGIQTPVPTPVPPVVLEELTENAVLGPAEYEEFCNYLDTLQATYNFYDLVDIEEALARYRDIELPEETGSKLMKDGTVNTAAFREQVIKNSEQFLANAPGGKYGPLPQSEFDASLSAIVEAAEYCLSAGTDPGRLDAKLHELKLVMMKFHGFGSTDYENYTIGINPTTIEAITTFPYDLCLTEIAMHEGNHLCQYFTPQEREKAGFAYGAGVCYQWEDLPENPLSWNWYYEGAAEKLAMAESGLEAPLTYETYIRFLDCMTPAFLMRDNTDPDMLEKLTLQPSLELFFDTLGFLPGEEIQAVQMMYALDIVLTRKPEFFEKYKAVYGENFPNQMDYANQLKSAAAQTLTKLFYRNLATFLQNEVDVSLQELFSLISQFEVAMSTLTLFSSFPEPAEEFVRCYQQIQSKFFDCLASQNDLPPEMLTTQFTAFHKDSASDSLYLPHLSEEKQAFLQGYVTRWKTNKKDAICALIT